MALRKAVALPSGANLRTQGLLSLSACFLLFLAWVHLVKIPKETLHIRIIDGVEKGRDEVPGKASVAKVYLGIIGGVQEGFDISEGSQLAL